MAGSGETVSVSAWDAWVALERVCKAVHLDTLVRKLIENVGAYG